MFKFKILVLTLITKSLPQNPDEKMKREICASLDCPSLPTEDRNRNVCGIQKQGEGFRVKVFENECELVMSGCNENTSEVYGITHDYYCKDLDFKSNDHHYNSTSQIPIFEPIDNKNKDELNNAHDTDIVALPANISDIVVVDGILDPDNINKSAEDFFAATRADGIRIQPMDLEALNNTRRGRVLDRIPGQVFTYAKELPPNQIRSQINRETLVTCFHTCPKECPEEYKPVCGVPGTAPRHPSLMFRNHCFMDQAQCRIQREEKKVGAWAVAYREMGFVFCLGAEVDMVYRFLPLLRTLQKMKRARAGKFRYSVRNWKYWNERLPAQYRPMG